VGGGNNSGKRGSDLRLGREGGLLLHRKNPSRGKSSKPPCDLTEITLVGQGKQADPEETKGKRTEGGQETQKRHTFFTQKRSHTTKISKGKKKGGSQQMGKSQEEVHRKKKTSTVK